MSSIARLGAFLAIAAIASLPGHAQTVPDGYDSDSDARCFFIHSDGQLEVLDDLCGAGRSPIPVERATNASSENIQVTGAVSLNSCNITQGGRRSSTYYIVGRVTNGTNNKVKNVTVRYEIQTVRGSERGAQRIDESELEIGASGRFSGTKDPKRWPQEGDPTIRMEAVDWTNEDGSQGSASQSARCN